MTILNFTILQVDVGNILTFPGLHPLQYHPYNRVTILKYATILGRFDMLKKLINRILLGGDPLKETAKNQFYSVTVKTGDIAIDCGANVGKITEYFCKTGATVYAFEPNPFAFEVLHQKFKQNKNIHCFQKGVYIQNDIMKLYLHEHSDHDEIYWSTGSSFIEFKGNIRQEKYVEIPVIDLCNFIESLNCRVRILKMDVEGVECPIITKIIDTHLINKIDYIFVETHDHKIPELKKETDELREIIRRKKITNINLYWE